MARGKGGLGRGLDSLFEDAAPVFESGAKVDTLPLREIEPDPEQPRKTFDEQALGELAYLTEGPEGLAVERRGRGNKSGSRQLPKEVEEDLLAEVQRLRAENAYLKNLQALVLERERRQRRNHW